MDPRFSRAYGALAGLALGDALGMPTQAMSPQQIQTVYGHVTGLVDGDKSQPYAPGMAAGSVTDDTEQALLIASLLLKGHGSGLNLDAGEFSHALLAWEDSMIERGSLDLLGPSTKAALERVRAGENPLRVGGEGTTNGAAMRVTPIGIAASTSDRQLFADAVWSSCQVTHATCQGFQSAALVAAAVSLGIDAGAADVTDLLWKAVAFVRSLPERGAWSPEPDVVAATHRALKLAAQPASSLEWLAGQIGTAVASAQAIPMAFALLARDPSPRALLQAANLGGDTDTIGAIAGAILGASLGVEVFDAYGLAQVEQVSQLDLPSVATDLLALRDREGGGAAPAAATTSPNPEKPALTPAASTQKDAPAGRVVLMGQILVDLAVRGEALPAPGGDVWASDEGMHVGGGFNALVAARRMGAQAVSLSPIGHGPYSLLIQQALQRAEITDAGPRIDGIDNGFCIAFTDQSGERTFISTRGAETRAPASAWADFTATMRPGDVLYIDGYLMDHPANRQAAQAALEALPEGVQVILDVSPVIGIPQGLPMRDVIVSMNHREAQQIINQSAERGLEQGQELSREQGQSQEQGQDGEQSQGRCQKQGQSQWCGQAREAGLVASLVASLLGRSVVVRAGAEGAYLARPAAALVASTMAPDAVPAVSAPTPGAAPAGASAEGPVAAPAAATMAASANAADVTYIPTPRVAAIDTNGAGDAHSGVLAAALAQAIPLERALLLANCAGALSTTLVGPAACPSREQIEAAADALAD